MNIIDPKTYACLNHRSIKSIFPIFKRNYEYVNIFLMEFEQPSSASLAPFNTLLIVFYEKRNIKSYNIKKKNK